MELLKYEIVNDDDDDKDNASEDKSFKLKTKIIGKHK